MWGSRVIQAPPTGPANILRQAPETMTKQAPNPDVQPRPMPDPPPVVNDGYVSAILSGVLLAVAFFFFFVTVHLLRLALLPPTRLALGVGALVLAQRLSDLAWPGLRDFMRRRSAGGPR